MDLAKRPNRKSPKKRPASDGPPARKKPALSKPPVPEVVDLVADDLLLASIVKKCKSFSMWSSRIIHTYLFREIRLYTKAAVSFAYHSYGTRVAVQH